MVVVKLDKNFKDETEKNVLQKKAMDEFARKNENDLRRFMKYKTRIIDEGIIDEAIQEFYVRLIEAKSLATFDEREGSFDAYILNLFCWTLPTLKKRGYTRSGNMVSTAYVETASSDCRDARDVWECLHMNPDYKVDPCYSNAALEYKEEEESEGLINEFIEYIRETEKGKKAERMITFIQRRREGCLSADVAVILKMADNHVKCIKQELYDKYKKWQKRNQWF